MSFVPSTSREDSNHQRNQETLRPATGVMLQSHNSSVSINPTVYPSISPSVSSPTFIPPYVNNTQSSTTNSNGRILQDIEAAHNFVIGQRDTSSYASHLSSEEPMATRSRYGESYNYGRNGDEYGISEATRASSERNQLDGESMRSLAHGSSSPSAGSVGATASVSARYEEYRADIEHLARKLSSARQVSEKKDQIIQDLNERLEAVLASQRNRSTCVDAACQVDSDKSDVPALTITLRGVVQQLFQVVTGEESDNVDEYDLTQCAEIISSRVEHIVKKIERLVGFRHEVVEFFLRKVERNPSTAPEDPLAVWRKGRSRVLELLEANAALQSEIEDITQRYEQLQQQLPEPRHLNRENSIDEDERSVWTREVASSYENVRSALMLCVRHTHWHQRNPRRGDDAEYHDMCEITRRMEEIQGRLHWVVANCLDEEERGPGGLQAPCNKDELLHALENAHRAATRRTSVTRLHTNSKSPVRTRYSSGTAASRASPTNTHTPHRGMSMSTARYGSVRSPVTPRHLTGLPHRTPTPTRTAVTRTHMGLAGGGDGGAYNRKLPIRGTHAVRAAPSIRTQLFKESTAGPSASRRPLASVVSNMTSRGTYMAEKESAGSYVRSGSMNTMLSSVPLNSNRRSGSTSPSRLLMIRKNGSIH